MVAVLAALEVESEGLFEQCGYSVFYSGMGHIAAAQKCTEVILKHRPQKIINLGTAGSFVVPVGSLVEGTQFVRRDATIQQLDEYLRVPARTHLPAVCCGSADYITHVADLSKPYNVMDMESYALAYVCQKYKIDFVCVKYITDASDVDFRKDWKLNVSKAAKALSEFLKSTKV